MADRPPPIWPRKAPPDATGDAETLAEILHGHAQEAVSQVLVVLDPRIVAGQEE